MYLRQWWSLCAVAVICAMRPAPLAAAPVEQRTPLFVYLHVLQPLEQDGAAAKADGDNVKAYHLYLRALRGYQHLDSTVTDWEAVRPRGLHQLIRQGLDRCDAEVKELMPLAQERDELLKRLNQPVNVAFKNVPLREVCKQLTLLTDVNIVVDDGLYQDIVGGPSPNVTIRVDQEAPLLQVIRLIVQQKGLAYSIEEDYIYISTRKEVDAAVGFDTTPWFRPS